MYIHVLYTSLYIVLCKWTAVQCTTCRWIADVAVLNCPVEWSQRLAIGTCSAYKLHIPSSSSNFQCQTATTNVYVSKPNEPSCINLYMTVRGSMEKVLFVYTTPADWQPQFRTTILVNTWVIITVTSLHAHTSVYIQCTRVHAAGQIGWLYGHLHVNCIYMNMYECLPWSPSRVQGSLTEGCSPDYNRTADDWLARNSVVHTSTLFPLLISPCHIILQMFTTMLCYVQTNAHIKRAAPSYRCDKNAR